MTNSPDSPALPLLQLVVEDVSVAYSNGHQALRHASVIWHEAMMGWPDLGYNRRSIKLERLFCAGGRTSSALLRWHQS